ncbi:MAG TPA: hypothetical protein VK025_04210 [Steroidobacter sp.]|jgi:hypothetical protein|nr:hypothetical protein [Steroidobacteraceae bacterium]HLS80588.1 hypothetical protein [Steroidobacter sp.]
MRRVSAFAGAAILILLLGVVFAPAPGGRLWLSRLYDFVHGPIFGAAAVLSLLALRRSSAFVRLAPARQYALALAISTLLGLLTEIAQIPVGRDASWADVRSDVLGAVAFLALFSLFDPAPSARPVRTARRVALAALGAILIGYLVAPFARAVIEYQHRRSIFPVIADFSERFDDYFVWRLGVLLEAAPAPQALRGAPQERAARVRFLTGRYPGLNFHEPWADWRGYQTLAVDVGNPGEQPLRVVVRVHDAAHDQSYDDRFNRAFILPPATRQTLRVALSDVRTAPGSREMDMSRVAGVVVFRDLEPGEAPHAQEMYLWRVWLE